MRRRVFAYAAHGLFTKNAMDIIAKSDVEEVRRLALFLCFSSSFPSQVIVTNTVPFRPDQEISRKVVQLSVAPVLAAAISRCHQNQSLQDLRVYCRDNVRPRYSQQE